MALTEAVRDRIRRTPDHQRIMVVGLGAELNLGHSWPEVFDTIRRGDTSNAVDLVANPPFHAGPVDRWDDLEVRFGIPLRQTDMKQHFSTKQLAVSDIVQQIAAKAAIEALGKDGANYWDTQNKAIAPDQRTAVIIATAVGGTLRLPEYQHVYEGLLAERAQAVKDGKNPEDISLKRPLRNASTKLLPGQVSSFVGNAINARGVRKSITTECSSTGTALDEALQELSYNHAGRAGLGFDDPRAKNTDLVVVGGAEVSMTRMSYIVFQSVLGMGALSKRNEDPQTASRPWDAEADGFVFGEGAIVGVLQRLSTVKKHGREASIRGEILSVAHVSDERSTNPIFPSEDSVVEAHSDALNQAGITPEMVDANIEHATSTGNSEITDALATLRVFGDHAARMPTISTKGISGHLLAASTILNLAVGLEAGRRGELPPNWNLFNRNPKLPGPDQLWLPTEPVQGDFEVITASGSGFGGNNVTIVGITRYIH